MSVYWLILVRKFVITYDALDEFIICMRGEYGPVVCFLLATSCQLDSGYTGARLHCLLVVHYFFSAFSRIAKGKPTKSIQVIRLS